MQGFVPDYMHKMRYLDRVPSTPKAINLGLLIPTAISCALSGLVIIFLVYRLILLIISDVPKPGALDWIAVGSGLAIVGGKFAMSLMVLMYAINSPKKTNEQLFMIIVVSLNGLILAFYITAWFVIGGQDPSGLTSSVLLLCVIVVGIELISSVVALVLLCLIPSYTRPMMMRAMPMYMPVQTMP